MDLRNARFQAPKSLGPRTQWMLRQQGRRPEDYSHMAVMRPAILPGSALFSKGAALQAEQEARDPGNAEVDLLKASSKRKPVATDRQQKALIQMSALVQAKRAVYERQLISDKKEAVEKEQEENKREEELRKACTSNAKADRMAPLGKACQSQLVFVDASSGLKQLRNPNDAHASNRSQEADNPRGPPVYEILKMALVPRTGESWYPSQPATEVLSGTDGREHTSVRKDVASYDANTTITDIDPNSTEGLFNLLPHRPALPHLIRNTNEKSPGQRQNAPNAILMRRNANEKLSAPVVLRSIFCGGGGRR